MAGTLDTSFGTNGIAQNPFFSDDTLNCTLLSMSIQNSNKIILGGSAQNPYGTPSNTGFGLARYNLDGSLDASFGSSGNGFVYYECSGNIITGNTTSSALTFDHSGNIIIGGYTQTTNVSEKGFYISRFTSDGIIDLSFSAPVVNIFPTTNSVGVTPLVSSSGNILLIGFAKYDGFPSLNNFSIACYNTDGSLKILWGDAGLNSFTFDVSGTYTGVIATCAALQTIIGTEYAIMAGYTVDASDNPLQFAMMRVNTATGDLDTTFGILDASGSSYTSFTDISGCGANSIVIKPDNKILLGGFINNSDGSKGFSMVQFLSDGTVDTTFGTQGRVDSIFQNSSPAGCSAYSIILQNDQKIIIGGYTYNSITTTYDYALVRYDSNGTIDTSFGTNGYTQTYPNSNGEGFSLAIQSDNKILLAGIIVKEIVPPFGPSTTFDQIGIARYLYTSITCFKEDTKILCLKDNEEKYCQVQELRSGDLVKTSMNGYIKIEIIGKSTIYNPGNNKRIKERLYHCSKENYTELFEDLYITGCHSILVDNITEDEREKTMELMNDIYVTDRKYRLMACVDKRAMPYETEGSFNIYHMALENDNYYMNYGIYANGLLVETTSKRWLSELSGMELL